MNVLLIENLSRKLAREIIKELRTMYDINRFYEDKKNFIVIEVHDKSQSLRILKPAEEKNAIIKKKRYSSYGDTRILAHYETEKNIIEVNLPKTQEAINFMKNVFEKAKIQITENDFYFNGEKFEFKKDSSGTRYVVIDFYKIGGNKIDNQKNSKLDKYGEFKMAYFDCLESLGFNSKLVSAMKNKFEEFINSGGKNLGSLSINQDQWLSIIECMKDKISI